MIKELERLYAVWTICVAMAIYAANEKSFRTVARWRDIEYALSPEEVKKNVPKTQVNRMASKPFDAFIYYGVEDDQGANVFDQKLFVAVPKNADKNKFTLGTLQSGPTAEHPVLMPYPSWEWHDSSTKCREDRIVSAVRLQVDACNRLWVLDSGRVVTDRVTTFPCRPKILVFSLEENEVLRHYVFDKNVTGKFMSVTNFVVDGCNLGYIADSTGYGIIIYNLMRDTAYRIKNEHFQARPAADGSYDKYLGDSEFGIFSLSIAPSSQSSFRVFPKLYYSLYNDSILNTIDLTYMRNDSLDVSRTLDWDHEILNTYPRAFDLNIVHTVITSNEKMILIDLPGQLYCWNIYDPFRMENIHSIPSFRNASGRVLGLKIINNPYMGEELLIISNIYDDYNYYNKIESAFVDHLLEGINC